MREKKSAENVFCLFLAYFLHKKYARKRQKNVWEKGRKMREKKSAENVKERRKICEMRKMSEKEEGKCVRKSAEIVRERDKCMSQKEGRKCVRKRMEISEKVSKICEKETKECRRKCDVAPERVTNENANTDIR